jgi:mannose-1-phosphate guanylyltransferase/mannose-6-phosphate isomerase
MIQDTALRFSPNERIDFLAPLVICNLKHGKMAWEQLSALNTPPAAVILEPFGRNTASVAVIAAAWAAAHAPGALVLLLPADHVVANRDGFRDAIEHAAPAARGHIVTFGIRPSGPETGYGYIQAGGPIYDGAFAVARFVEKPSRPIAEAYLQDGGYYWNAGIFFYEPQMLLTEARTYCSEILESGLVALQDAAHDGPFITLDEKAFAACPSEPIDTAVMEKTEKGAIVPCDIGWADLGSWSELWQQGSADDHSNVSRGEVLAIETTGSLIWSDGPSVSVLGVADMIVIATAAHVLVLPKDRAQDVKKIVDELRRKAAL